MKKELEAKVLKILKEIPETRDDDTLLTFWIVKTYLPQQVKAIDGQWFVSLSSMRTYREDHVKRIRAKIQNEQHKYLPTSWEVAKQRRIAEAEWESWSRHNPITNND